MRTCLAIVCAVAGASPSFRLSRKNSKACQKNGAPTKESTSQGNNGEGPRRAVAGRREHRETGARSSRFIAPQSFATAPRRCNSAKDGACQEDGAPTRLTIKPRE
jgi:hypothetical protein